MISRSWISLFWRCAVLLFVGVLFFANAVRAATEKAMAQSPTGCAYFKVNSYSMCAGGNHATASITYYDSNNKAISTETVGFSSIELDAPIEKWDGDIINAVKLYKKENGYTLGQVFSTIGSTKKVDVLPKVDVK
jgi:hypothetical protein